MKLPELMSQSHVTGSSFGVPHLAGTKTGVNDYRGKSLLFTPGPIYPGKNCGLAHKFYDKSLV